MGTCSYVLTGTDEGMRSSFGSTCHGAGRALSRSKSRRTLDWNEVLDDLREKGISIRIASPKLVTEEVKHLGRDLYLASFLTVAIFWGYNKNENSAFKKMTKKILER